jgi:hypothetical protein
LEVRNSYFRIPREATLLAIIRKEREGAIKNNEFAFTSVSPADKKNGT